MGAGSKVKRVKEGMGSKYMIYSIESNQGRQFVIRRGLPIPPHIIALFYQSFSTMTQPKVLQSLPNVPRGAMSYLVENHLLDERTATLKIFRFNLLKKINCW